jgi:hypothetical protein
VGLPEGASFLKNVRHIPEVVARTRACYLGMRSRAKLELYVTAYGVSWQFCRRVLTVLLLTLLLELELPLQLLLLLLDVIHTQSNLRQLDHEVYILHLWCHCTTHV